MHHMSVPRGYPVNHPRLAGPRATTEAQLLRGTGTSGRTPAYQADVYGTRPVYITQDPGRAIFPLRDYRRGSSTETFSLLSVVGVRWVFPNQRIPSMGCSGPTRSVPNLGFPTLDFLSGLQCEPFFGLAALVGCRRHVANYLERRPSIVYRS